MSQQGLKLHHAAACKYEVLCKGVTEQMNGCFCDASGDVVSPDRPLERSQIELIAFVGWIEVCYHVFR